MKVQLLVCVALPLVLWGTVVQAQIAILQDPGETAQSLLGDTLNANIADAKQRAVALLDQREILNGGFGAKNIVDQKQLAQLFFGGVNRNDVGRAMASFGGGNGGLGKIMDSLSPEDLLNFDGDAYKARAQGKLENLTESQLKNLLGSGISDKLSPDQIKSLLDNPSQLTSFLEGLFNGSNRQRQAANGLEGMGLTPGSSSRSGSSGSSGRSGSGSGSGSGSSETAEGRNGNRSHVFGGTGTGSETEYAEARKQFEDMRAKIEKNAQLPQSETEMAKLTVEELKKISLFQTEMVKELATQGLAKAWIRQEVAKVRQPKREEEAVKLINEKATDIRNAIGVVSLVSIMSNESQNYTTDVYASNLADYGALVNQRIGTTFFAGGSSEKASEESNGTTQ